MKATMDEVIFNRDLDASGGDPHGRFVAKFEGHAGMRAAPRARGEQRKGFLCVPGRESDPRQRSLSARGSPGEASTRTPSPRSVGGAGQGGREVEVLSQGSLLSERSSNRWASPRPQKPVEIRPRWK